MKATRIYLGVRAIRLYVVSKLPYILLFIAFIAGVALEKKWSGVSSKTKEAYVNNNSLTVSKMGGGTICVHNYAISNP